jgi:hypothetical protein
LFSRWLRLVEARGGCLLWLFALGCSLGGLKKFWWVAYRFF